MPYSLGAGENPLFPYVTITSKPTRSYVYHDVATILDMPKGSKPVHVYGVILDCRAPCTTNGQQLRTEVVIADESCVSSSGTLRTFPVHCFIDDPNDAIPFREVGDIVRLHRVQLIDYTPKNDSIVRQGRVKPYSSAALWRHDDHEFEPFITKIFENEKKNGSPLQKLDQGDFNRVSALRKWSRRFVFRKHISQRQFLRIVPEVLSAPNDAIFINKSFDLACYLQTPPVLAENGTISMSVCHQGEHGVHGVTPTNIVVLSREPHQWRDDMRRFKFVDFCPSWKFKPNKPSWLVLRDARIAHRGQERIIELGVGGRTSTLIWNNGNAPDVRAAQAIYEEYRRSQGTHAITNSAIGYPMPQPHRQTTPKRPRTWDTNHDHGSKQIPWPTTDRYPDKDGTLKRRRQTDAQSTSEDKRSHEATNNDPVVVQKAAPIAEDRGPGQRTAVPNGNSTDIVLEPYESLITTHDHCDRKVWRIQDMVRAFRVGYGERKMFRLAVWARGLAWPRDLRLACRPLCKRCDKDVLVLGDKCDKCGSQDKRWHFALRFVLEDRVQGARIESWVTGREAERFLGFHATDLRKNQGRRELLKQRLEQIISAVKVVDCLVIPYEYEDEMGVYRITCAMKGTRCLV